MRPLERNVPKFWNIRKICIRKTVLKQSLTKRTDICFRITETEKTLGLFAHADVVEVSDDWVHTAPFEPLEKEGYLIGRGVLNDKSAVVISLYCAKILKELNIPFNSKLVMFTGSNEETGMEDVENYVKTHAAPDFSLACDTAFPKTLRKATAELIKATNV